MGNRLLSGKVDQLKITGGGGGGVDSGSISAMEGRLSHHLQELKYKVTN